MKKTMKKTAMNVNVSGTITVEAKRRRWPANERVFDGKYVTMVKRNADGQHQFYLKRIIAEEEDLSTLAVDVCKEMCSALSEA